MKIMIQFYEFLNFKSAPVAEVTSSVSTDDRIGAVNTYEDTVTVQKTVQPAVYQYTKTYQPVVYQVQKTVQPVVVEKTVQPIVYQKTIQPAVVQVQKVKTFVPAPVNVSFFFWILFYQ